MEWVNGLKTWIDDRWNRAPVSGPRKSANKSSGSIGLQCSGSCVCWHICIFEDIPWPSLFKAAMKSTKVAMKCNQTVKLPTRPTRKHMHKKSLSFVRELEKYVRDACGLKMAKLYS